MNDPKLNQLFAQAKKDAALTASETFASGVVADLPRRQTSAVSEPWWQLLETTFPRLAIASVLLMGLCAASDLYLNSDSTSLTGEVGALSAQWLFAGNLK